MNIEQIKEVVESVVIRSIDLSIRVKKSDLVEILSKVLRKEIPKIDKLPEGIKLEFIELVEISVLGNRIFLVPLIRMISDKLLLPNQSDLRMELSIPIITKERYIQLEKPKIKIVSLEKDWKHKLLQGLFNKLLDWNDKKLAAVVENQVNPILSNPRSWNEKFKELIGQDFGMLVDYRLDQFELSEKQKNLVLETTLDGGLNYEIGETKSWNGLILCLKSTQILKMLLKKINSDIEEKLDQEIELTSIDFISKNHLKAEGSAAVMNISKEFSLDAFLVFNNSTNRLNLEVGEINVEGGYLIRKGFSMIEPRIRKKIEEAVDVNLEKILKNLRIPMSLPLPESKYVAQFNELDLSSLEIDKNGENLNVGIEFEMCHISLNPDDFVERIIDSELDEV